MRTLPTIVSTALAAVFLVATIGSGQGKGKPTPNPRIKVTFADRFGDTLVSDGSGSYTDCDSTPLIDSDCDGLGQIWAGGTEDATFRMSASGRRYSVVGFSPDGWFLNVRAIGTLAVGSVKVAAAVFSFDGDQGGPQPWASDANKRFQWSGLNGSQLVHVTRNSATVWTIDASPSSSISAFGAMAVLDQQNQKTSKYTVVGTYEMPFSLTIECVAYCDRLTVK